jgi:transporter family protein
LFIFPTASPHLLLQLETGVILQFVAALLGTILLGSLMLGADKSFELHYDRNGLAWSVAAGLAVGLAEMLSFCVSGLGVPATQSIPIIIGGSVMFGAVLGLIVLGEKLMLQGWSGIALLVIGVVFVALDPGEKVEEGGGGSSGEAVEGTPPAYWVAIALICASAYAFYNIFIKKGSASMNPILGGKNAHAIDWFMKARCLLILVSIHPCG